MRILFVCLILTGSVAHSQPFRPGYIVKDRQDTLRVLIKEEPEPSLSHSVSVKTADAVVRVSQPGEIIAFGFDGGASFRATSFQDALDSSKTKRVFAKLLMQGSLGLFSFRDRKNEKLYFLVSEGDTVFLLFDDEKNLFGEIVVPGNYQNMLAYFGHGCKGTGARVEKANYHEADLLDFFMALERCRGGSVKPIVSYSKPASKINVYFFAGGLILNGRSGLTGQAIVQFHFPSVSRKVSLNTGLVYLRNSEEVIYTYYPAAATRDHVTSIIEIPLMIRYDFLDGRVRPYLFGGPGLAVRNEKGEVSQSPKGFQGSFGVTVIAGAGLDFGLGKNFIVKGEWRYDLLLHLPSLGIAYRVP